YVVTSCASASITPSGPALAVLLYDHEVVERVPEEPHDRPVHVAVTPGGTRRFTGG
ncbi:hypothetical protein GXP76_26340, partial [Streptomyces sp. NP-1717]|nr:hypothetical protein [Streptomyces sp. NP-1717]